MPRTCSVFSLPKPTSTNCRIKSIPKGAVPASLRSRWAFEKGRKMFAHQTYQILNDVTNGNTVVLEVVWTGKLAIPFGTLWQGPRCVPIPQCLLNFATARSWPKETTTASSLGSSLQPRTNAKAGWHIAFSHGRGVKRLVHPQDSNPLGCWQAVGGRACESCPRLARDAVWNVPARAAASSSEESAAQLR